MDAFLARFDRGLEVIDRGAPLAGLVGAGAQLDGPHAREGKALFQRTLRALYAAGAFGELEPADQLHPGVQDRMWRLVPEMDQVMEAHQRLLAGLRPSDHERLQAHLRADPGLPLRLAEALDDAATEEGLGPSRRGRLRLAATEIGTRLRTQPPALLVGEYLDKARRIQEREGGIGSTERALAARMGEAAFWEYRAWAEREALAWRERLAAGSAGGDFGSGDGSGERASARTARKGAKLLGIGVITGGLLALTQLNGMNLLVFGVTVGVILALIGLVALLVAGLQRLAEASGPRSDEEEISEEQVPAEVVPAPAPAAPEPPASPPPPPTSSDPIER